MEENVYNMKEDERKHEHIGDQIYEIPRVCEIAGPLLFQFVNFTLKKLPLLYEAGAKIAEIVLEAFGPKLPVVLHKKHLFHN